MEDSTYLEDFLTSIEFLPNDLRRDFELMREYDKDSVDISRELKSSEQKFIQRAMKLGIGNAHSLEESSALMESIKNTRLRAKERSAQKVHIASNVLKDLEKFIRKLDSDLVVFETELRNCGEFEVLSRGVEPGCDVSISVIVRRRLARATSEHKVALKLFAYDVSCCI